MFIDDVRDAMGPYIGPTSFYSLVSPICQQALLDKEKGVPWKLDRFVTKLREQIPVYYDCPPECASNLTNHLVTVISSKFHFYLES